MLTSGCHAALVAEDFADCDFEESVACHWAVDGDAAGWTIAAAVNAHSSPVPAPTVDHTFLDTGDDAAPVRGSYLLAATASPGKPTRIRSWPFSTSNAAVGLDCRLSFWYSLAGSGASLSVEIMSSDNRFDQFTQVT